MLLAAVAEEQRVPVILPFWLGPAMPGGLSGRRGTRWRQMLLRPCLVIALVVMMTFTCERQKVVGLVGGGRRLGATSSKLHVASLRSTCSCHIHPSPPKDSELDTPALFISSRVVLYICSASLIFHTPSHHNEPLSSRLGQSKLHPEPAVNLSMLTSFSPEMTSTALTTTRTSLPRAHKGLSNILNLPSSPEHQSSASSTRTASSLPPTI